MAGAGDLDAASAALADAFADYPWTRWTVDADDHRGRIRALQRLVMEHIARLGFVVTGEVDVPGGGPHVWAMTRGLRVSVSG